MTPGRKTTCDICTWEGHRFGYTAAISVDQFRANEICLRCGSNQRTRDLVALVREVFDLEADEQTIADVGGSPSTRPFFDRFPNVRYLIVDRYKSADVPSDITNIDLPDDSVDGVLCCHVLEHIGDYRRAMRELHRILKPGRQGIVLVPQTKGLPESKRLSAESFDGYGHLWEFGDDFAALLRSEGFAVRSCERRGRIYHVVTKHRAGGSNDSAAASRRSAGA